MKIVSIIVSLLFVGAIFGQNSLVINNLEAGSGNTAALVIALENENEVSSFQFTLKVPNTLLVDEKEVRFLGRNTNHVIYPKNKGNGEYLFICFSGSNDNFSGNSGALMEIPIEIPLSYTAGQTFDMLLNDVIVSSSAGEDIGSNHRNGVLTITEGKTPDLVVANIAFSNPEMIPGEPSAMSWDIKNIGQSTALGGWRAQVYISSLDQTKEYLIGTASYSGDLVENETETRTAQFELPSVLGLDGDVKIKVVVLPFTSVKETEEDKRNNTTFSDANANLAKKLLFTIDKTEIVKNAGDEIRVNLSRSGAITIAEEFTITATNDEYLELPLKIVLEENQSSNFGYIALKPSTTYSGDIPITLTATDGTYPVATNEILVLEDQKISLSIDYPSDYNATIGSTIPFTLRANGSNSIAKTITISSNHSNRLQLPETVVLLGGETAVTFEGTILDPGTVEKQETITLLASATDYISASKDIAIASVNIPDFELSLAPDTVSEGDGIRATYATLKRTTNTDKRVLVSIDTDGDQRLIVPSTIVFEPEELEKRFNVGTIDNGTVEGEQSVTVFSKIQFERCTCTDETDPKTIASDAVTIIDNDGLALSLRVSPSTIKAGTLNNSLTISRNVTNPDLLVEPVEVVLSSDMPSVVTLPPTATIPANETTVVITFDTEIDATLNGDQNVRVEAQAVGYNTGFSWLLITDQNLPDVIISAIQSPNQVEAGTKVTINSTITNQGYADFASGAEVAYYLSPNNSIVDLEPFSTSILPVEIKAGTSYDFSEEIQLPIQSGTLNLIVVVNGSNAITELSIVNNQGDKAIEFLPAYTVTVATDKELYACGEKVLISGVAKTSDGSVAPTSDVEITITGSDFSRVFEATTNNNGAFVYEFEPLENESGTYALKAAYPGANIAAQETFDILGFAFIEKPTYVKWEPFVDFPLGKEFILKNNTTVDLTGVQITLPEDADFTLEQTPITIAAGQEAALGFTILATQETLDNQYAEIPITITSLEGAKYREIVYYYSKSKQASLVANPISINTTMIKDATRLYEFTIQNIGDVAANAVEVLVPSLPWLQLKSPQIIDVIAAGQEAKIILELTPTRTEQVNVPLSGTFVFKAENSNTLTVPVRVETVSEATGSIVVDATDEYTYNTASAPHLEGARVTVKHPYTGAIVAEGITDANGLFEVPTINEGYYKIDVSADKHNPYQATILVDPGKTTSVMAFMQYQAITYSWDVVATEVEDEYDITLVTEFETNVPKPVLVMEVDNTTLDLEEGETRQLNLTITNHGLIAAFDVKLGAAQSGGYDVKFLIESMESLPAKTSVVVPVILTRTPSGLGNKSASTANQSCPWLNFLLDAFFICAGDIQLHKEFPMDSYGGCLPQYDLGVYDGPPRGPSAGGEGGGRWGGFNPPNLPFDFPSLCDPCFGALIGGLLGCSPSAIVGNIACGFGVLTSSDVPSVLVNGGSCLIPYPFGCAFGIGGAIGNCIINPILGLKGEHLYNSNESNVTSTNSSVFELVEKDFQKITDSYQALNNTALEYFQDSTVIDNEDYALFVAEIGPYIDAEIPITVAGFNGIKENLKDADIEEAFLNGFFMRWNTTIKAWNQNILSPNAQYPDIINKSKLEEYNAIRKELERYTTARGFISVDEMYEDGYAQLQEYIDEKSEEQSSVCATVTIEFPQRLTMTREAFEGTLKINNSSSKSIKEIQLELIVKNELGENKTELFQINKDAFLNGTGVVDPDSNGSGVAIFIPTKAAAPETKQAYSFGGILSYFDEELGETVSFPINPVTLEVNPSPDLILDYFLQRDIIADDPLTEHIIEPSYPAELSLMITNDGFGEANNVKVESMQPRIVDNEKGLAIAFEMIGSNFNTEPKQLGMLEVDYGTIAPKTSSIGQWYFTSSLIGHFVSYDINVNHKSSFGNENLSLIKEANVHELIKSVKAYQDGTDDLADFLVNDVKDFKDTPDRIFYSNGTSEQVIKAESVASSNAISATNLTTTITIKPFTTGWNYGVLTDPGNAQYRLHSITRNTDGVEIPLSNFWQTSVTLRDGLNPKYENNLHVLDKISEITTYTLSYIPKDTNTPKISAIQGVPEDQSTATPVELLTVTFTKEIDVTTFDTNAITLVHQGVEVETNAILIGKIDATTYSISLQGLTEASGYYEVTINTIDIKDTVGNTGESAERVTWIQFLNELGVLKFESDQVKKSAINSLNITFNKEIRSEEFTTDKITINGNPVNTDIAITKIDGFNYSISGMDTYNQDNGTYTLDIDLPLITAVDGTKGLAVQIYPWIVDNNLPEIVTLTPKNQGGIHAQNRTEIDLELNRKLSNTLPASAISFTKNGQALSIPITLQKTADTRYTIFGLGDYTTDNANYIMTIDQTTLIDENENIGIGNAETSWTVNLSALQGLSNVKITPDIGVSDTDNITAGNDIALQYETLEDNLTVAIFELLATSEVLAYKNVHAAAGVYSIPLTGKVGSKRFKVIATDANGNRSEPEIVTAYIDFIDITATITPVKETAETDCYDFDHALVSFSEAITDNTFTTAAIRLKSSGIEIPKDEVSITKIDDKNYRLEGIGYDGDGLITMEIDQTKITKKNSGMAGVNSVSKELGVLNKYQATVVGEQNPTLGQVYTYTAAENLKKYDWIIINGTIIATSDNTVTVSWNTLGEQSLLLRYQTPFNCSATAVNKVAVNDGVLLVNNDLAPKMNIGLTPVPNQGQFSIHTSQELNNCTLAIFNTTGQLIYEEKNVNSTQNVKNIDIQNIPSGIYILVVHYQNEKFDFKFVVE